MGSDPGSGPWTSGGSGRQETGGDGPGGAAADPDRHRAIHVGLGQPRPRARGRHHSEPHGQPLARADSRRQTGRAKTTSWHSGFRPNGRWRRATRGVPRRRCCSFCRPEGRATGCGASRRRRSRSPRARKGTWSRRRRRRRTEAGVAVVVKEAGRRHLAVMNQDGQGSQTLAAIHRHPWGRPTGRRTAAWIAAGGRDAAEPGLFAIPVDGGTPRRLVPVWPLIRPGLRAATSWCMRACFRGHATAPAAGHR